MTTLVRDSGEPGSGTRDTGERRAGLGGVARGGVVNLAGAGFSGLAGLAVTTLIARVLGAGAAGVFFAATSAFLLAQMLAKLGTDTGMVYWMARLRAAGRYDLLHRCLRIGLLPVLVAGVLAAVAIAIAAPWLAGLPALAGGTPGGDTAEFVRALRVLAVFLPIAALSDALLSATRGYRTMRPTVLVEKTLRPALQLVLLALVLLAVTTTAATLGWAAPYLVSAALAGYLLVGVDRTARRDAATPAAAHADADPHAEQRQHTAVATTDADPHAEQRQPGTVTTTDADPHAEQRRPAQVPDRLGAAFWRFTAPRAAASVSQSALQRFDVILVAGLLGFRAAALYTVATRFLVVGQLANQAIGSAVQPRLAELLGRRDLPAVRALYAGSTAWVVLLTWPLYLLVAAFAPLYLRVFGAGYAGDSPADVVAVLSLAMLVAAGCGMVDMVLTMGGRTTWNLANVALALGVNVVLDLLLIPRVGIVGAAAGWAVALLVKNLVPLGQIAVVLRLHPFGAATRAAALVTLGTVGVPAAAARLLLGTGPGALAATLAAAVPGYLVACVLLRRRLGLDRLPVRLGRGRRR